MTTTERCSSGNRIASWIDLKHVDEKRLIRILTAFALAVTLSIGAAACGSDEAEDAGSAASSDADSTAEVTVADAWVRQPADRQTVAAAYGTIANGTDETITLTGASVPLTSERIEIHQTSIGDDGAMSMSEQEGGFEIEPGASFTLEPGGPHGMMFGVDPAEFDGPIEVTFEFDTTDVTVTAELREIGDSMADMDDDSMTHDDG